MYTLHIPFGAIHLNKRYTEKQILIILVRAAASQYATESIYLKKWKRNKF